MKKITFILFLIFLFSSAFGQKDNLQVFELRGKIFDSETKKPVVFAHVINLKKGLATITDTAGYFRIIMLKTDSIRFSSIGYEISFFVLPDTSSFKNQYFNIYIKPKIYDLSTINIFEERWKAFEYDISNTKIEEDKNQQSLELWIENIISERDLKMIATAARGVGFPLNFRSSRDKQLEIVAELTMQAELNRQAEEKFNKELIAKITGLSGIELEDFMKHCKFDRDFILKRTEYDLIVIVLEIFEIYKEEKQ